MARSFDIIIAGAGMIGACAAVSLAKRGFSVALLEPMYRSSAVAIDESEYDLRVSAISPTSQQILTELGVWAHIDQSRICHYEKMQIWHESGEARITFDSVDSAQNNLGSIVENRQVLQALHHACDNNQNIEWFHPDSIESLQENSDQGLSVTLTSGLMLEAELLIVADGRSSPTRQLADFDVNMGDYQQQAIVANVQTELPHQQTAWQRFLKTGPLAFLPLANDQSSIVWSCDNALAEDMMALKDDDFCLALATAVEHQFGRITGISERRSFPLGWHCCNRWLNNRALLIGDAAHGVHPLAGQGVNLGFSDVFELTQCLAESDTAWHYRSLRQFERRRKSDTAIAMHAFSGLKWVYGNDNPLISQARDLGMRLVEQTPIGKRLLMQQALQNLA